MVMKLLRESGSQEEIGVNLLGASIERVIWVSFN